MEDVVSKILSPITNRYIYNNKQGFFPNSLYNQILPDIENLKSYAQNPTYTNKQAYINSSTSNVPLFGGMAGNINSTPLPGTMNPNYPNLHPFEDLDTAIDIVKGKVRGSIDDIMAAHDTVMSEAKRQLTPDELGKSLSINNIINKLQQRIKPEEQGIIEKATKL